MSADAHLGPDLDVLVERVIRRGHHLRRRRIALQASSAALALALVFGASLAFRSQVAQDSLRTINDPDPPDAKPFTTTSVVAEQPNGVGGERAAPRAAPPAEAAPVPASSSSDGRSVATTNGRIAFASSRDSANGYYSIYTMNADGSGQTRLTFSPLGDIAPAWSPDGTRIAFSSARDGVHAIYVMNADGSAQTRVSNVSGYAEDPTWSPDGTQIAFTVYPSENGCVKPGPEPSRIWIMNVDGTGAHPVTGFGDTSFSCGQAEPAWSPDGRHLAFVEYPYSSNGPRVYVLDVATGESTYAAAGFAPSWAPDARSIAFVVPDRHAVRVVGADTTGLRDVVTGNPDDLFGSTTWSSDGQRIVFSGSRCTSGKCDASQFADLSTTTPTVIYSVALDGTSQTPLTNGQANDVAPDFQR